MTATTRHRPQSDVVDMALHGPPTRSDAQRLIHCWMTSHDQRYAERLIASLDGLIRSRVRRITTASGDFDDLMQVGRTATWKAMLRYEPERAAFTTFAVRTIDGELRRWFRDHTWDVHVPRREQDLMLRVRSAAEQLTSAGHLVSVETLARGAGLSHEEVVDGLLAAQARGADRLDAPIGGEGRPRRETLVAEERVDLDLRMDLRAAIGRLPARQAEAIRLHYGEGLPHRDIAARTGWTLRQIARLLMRARATLADELLL